MNKLEEVVFIIDDDNSIRRSLSLFLNANNYTVETFASSEEYLARDPFNGTGCLLLDINLQGKSGLELQEELIAKNSKLPIIFITGRGNIQTSVQALKKGAVNFLEKPFSHEVLVSSISEALDLSRKYKAVDTEILKARQLVESLTPREYEILKNVMSGMLNKQIAAELAIAEQTVKFHRHSICEKMGVKSVPELIRIADKAGVISTDNKY